jgi:hypothetical protein
MKHKISVALLSTAFVLGLASAGFVGTRAVAQAKAASTDTVQVFGTLKGVDHWSTAISTLTYNSTTSRFEGSVFLYKDDQFKLLDSTANKWAGYHTDLGTAIVKGSNSAVGDNIVAIADGTYTISVADFSGYDNASYIFQSATGSITFAAPTTSYTITEYGVYDGTKNDTAIGTETAYDGQAFTPTDQLKSGYSLDGWFSDATCATAYTATTISADTVLYAKYTSLTGKKYVYFSAPSGWTDCYAYTFGGKKGLGDFPGTKITLATDGVTYQGSGIYKVLYYSDANDTSILFNKGVSGTVGTDQTADLILAENVFYKLADASTGDADRGLAAAVVYDINVARRAVAASGSISAGSICGIGKVTAGSLLAEYEALDATAQGYVNAATDYVYNYADVKEKLDVTYEQIIAQLRIIANKSGTTPAALTGNGDSSWTPAWIALISLGVAAVASAGLLISRRKHE